MFVLYKVNDVFRGAFICDNCQKPIETIEDAKAIIASHGSKYHPRSQVHSKCFDEDSINKDEDNVMALREYIKVMNESFPVDPNDLLELSKRS